MPARLLEQLQEYIEGELIYIPRKDEKRKGWGEANGTRRAIQSRNMEIQRRYKGGETISSLATSYHLSKDSIRKIVYRLSASSR